MKPAIDTITRQEPLEVIYLRAPDLSLVEALPKIQVAVERTYTQRVGDPLADWL